MVTGHLLTTARDDSDAPGGSEGAVEIEVDEAELAKLNGLDGGVPVVLDAVVVAAPDDRQAPASYPALHLGDARYGLTAIASPPPERDTTVVRLEIGQKISLRIVAA